MKTRSKTEEKKDRRTNRPSPKELYAHGFVKLCGTPANMLAKWGSIALLVIFSVEPISNAIVALSGEETNANIQFSAKADVNINNGNKKVNVKAAAASCDNYLYLALLGGLVGFGGFYEAQRRKKMLKIVIHEKSKRIQELEKKVDPSRTSCGLTSEGDTNPEDL